MTTGPASTTGPTRRRSFASSGLTYEQVARELGLRLCTGCMEGHWATNAARMIDMVAKSERRHQSGWVSIRPLSDEVHWSRDRMTRRGLYQFLRLASYLLYPNDTVHQERWLALYRQDQHARRLARRFRVRIPAEYGKREKARVRLDLTKIGPLDTEFPEQRQLIRRVQAWARP